MDTAVIATGGGGAAEDRNSSCEWSASCREEANSQGSHLSCPVGSRVKLRIKKTAEDLWCRIEQSAPAVCEKWNKDVVFQRNKSRKSANHPQ